MNRKEMQEAAEQCQFLTKGECPLCLELGEGEPEVCCAFCTMFQTSECTMHTVCNTLSTEGK